MNNIEGKDGDIARGGKAVRGFLIGCLGTALWGFSGVCINFLTNNYAIGEAWIGCVRLLASGLIFLVACLLTQREQLVALLHDRVCLGLTVAYAAVGMAIMQVVYIFAIETAGAACDSLIAQTMLTYVMLVTCIQQRRRPRRYELICIVLAFVGVFCVATKGDMTTLAIGLVPLLFCLGDGLLMAAHNLIPLLPLRSYGTVPVNSVALVLGGLMLCPVAQPWAVSVELDAIGWAALAATVILGAGLGYLLASQGLKDAGAVLGTFASVVEPVSSMAFSVALLGVTFTGWDVAGCVCIAAMMVYLSLGKSRADAEAVDAESHDAEVHGE